MKKEKYFCRDCNKEIETKEDKTLIGGKLLKFEVEDMELPGATKKVFIIKCNECFKKDPSLKNYQKCEVYSRVVGYLRPVQQWNEGKAKEYKDRKEYKVK